MGGGKGAGAPRARFVAQTGQAVGLRVEHAAAHALGADVQVGGSGLHGLRSREAAEHVQPQRLAERMPILDSAPLPLRPGRLRPL